jgi:hypothetical protein
MTQFRGFVVPGGEHTQPTRNPDKTIAVILYMESTGSSDRDGEQIKQFF